MNHSPYKSYIIGFIFSIALTCAAFFAVSNSLFKSTALMDVVIGLAMLQVFVQLFFFLHIGQEKSPRLNLWMLLITVIAICVLVFGSIWIMYHLNYNMSPQEMEKAIMNDQGAI